MDRQSNSPTNLDRCVLGTAGLGGVWGKVDKKESIKAILEALDNGITAIDTAPAYGDAELLVGDALNQWNGSMPALSTKVGRLKSYAADESFYDYSSEGLEKSVKESLRTLGVPAVDILLLHEPSAINIQEVERVLEKMMEFKQKGYAKRIGVGGNSPAWFKKYITPDIFDVIMEYNRLNACCLDALNTSMPECELKGIDYYVASPLHMGLLGSRFEFFTENPPAWLDKRDIDNAIQIKRIAEKHCIQLASLSHRFLLTIPRQFKIVIGACDSSQLHNTLSDFTDGILNKDIYTEIINGLNK
jgi:aryl-alcohol dehydrogenase-like predicted oxidoreductase